MALDLNELRRQVRGAGPTRVQPPLSPTPTRSGSVVNSSNTRSGGGTGKSLVIVAMVAVAAFLFFSKREEPQSPQKPQNVAPPAPVLPPVAASQPLSPPAIAEQTTPSLPEATSPLSQMVAAVVTANRVNIEAVLSLAVYGQRHDVEAAALAAGRSFDFSTQYVERNRREARALNELSLAAFLKSNYTQAYELGMEAFRSDPLDVEIVGNLAIYALRTDRVAQAQDMAIYALSLPRAAEKTGRTSDWNTLGASFATIGQPSRARAALFVTLALAQDIPKRCVSAVYSVHNAYGDVLKDATEAMFERVRQQDLSSAPECQLPILW